MSKFRVTSSGKFRSTGSGALRIVDGVGAILGTAALVFSAGASATLSTSGSTSMSMAATGQLSARAEMQGSTALQFSTAGTAEGIGPYGTTSTSFSAVGTLTGLAYMQGTADSWFVPSASLGSIVYRSGSTSLHTTAAATITGRVFCAGAGNFTFGASANLTGRAPVTGFASTTFNTQATGTLLLGGKFRSYFLRLYEARQELLNALDADARERANAARTIADANATAVSGLSTRVDYVEGTLTAQSEDITTLQSSISAKTTTFAQNTAPSTEGRVVGDTWIDLDDGNKLYTWDGTQWALRALDAGIQVFAQATAPTATGRKVGDLWYDTDDNNKQYRWNGSGWAAIDDQRISATATAVQGLTTRVDFHDGKFTTVEAKWNITLDVNGYVSGVESINNGSLSTFTVKADVFKIISPGAPALTPFEVRGGTTYIKDAAIEKLTIGKLSSGTLNADMNLGSGRIIYDNGVVMMVQGIGFGSSNQFIEWFGPRQTTGGLIDLTKCTEANAKSYKKTNGDEYMGGTLSVGVLKNGAQSTQVSTNATVETGQFGSNGGARTVNYSLNYYNIGNSNTNAGAGPTSVVVTLQRSVNGGAWTTLSSFTATGAKTAEWDAELGYYAVEVTCGGSATYTDNSGGLGPINYRLVLSSPSGAWPWTNQGGSPGTQSLSVQSIEG